MAFWNRKQKAEAAPRMETLRSSNMLLRIAAPVGENWQRMEAGAKSGMLGGFKCIHGTPPDALALDAMLYEKSPSMPATLEALQARDWRAHFLGKMFASLSELVPKKVQHFSTSGFPVTALELTAAGTLRQPAQALRVVERYVPFDKQLLVISVAGAPEQHTRHALVINSWLGNATLED